MRSIQTLLSNAWIRRGHSDVFPLGATCNGSLGSDPISQLGVSRISRNIAVPVDFAIVGKLAQSLPRR
jgi:hypothetical protein